MRNRMPYNVVKRINTVLEYEDGQTEEYQDNVMPQVCSLECVVAFINKEQKFRGIQKFLDSEILSITEFQPEGWWVCGGCGKSEQYPGGEYSHGTECHCARCMGE